MLYFFNFFFFNFFFLIFFVLFFLLPFFFYFKNRRHSLRFLETLP